MTSLLAFTGCVSTTQKLIKKSELETSTQMSSTVWLDPVGGDKRTAFLQIRNTSDMQLSMQEAIATALKAKGYKITQDPDKAHYWIQANVLKVGKSDLDESKGLLANGYGNAIGGAVIGSQFGGGSGQGAMAIGGALLGAAADAIWEDVLFTMVTDLQISERAKDGVEVNEANNQVLKQGTSGAKVQTSNETLNRKKYQTRIVSTANQVNLTLEEAVPSLKEGLVRSIAGIL
tara:strand:- start:17954 stop:18649 length:696 start_codon:yes stop_codon:yes gene_type:complete